MQEQHKAALRFRLHTGKNFFTVKVVKHWHRLLINMVDALCLSVIKSHVDYALSNTL